MFRPTSIGRIAQTVAKTFAATALCFGLAILAPSGARAVGADGEVMTLNDLSPGSATSVPSPAPQEYSVPVAPPAATTYGAPVVDPNIYYRWPDGSIQLTPPPGTPAVGTTSSGGSPVASVPSTTVYYDDPGELVVTAPAPAYAGSVVVYDSDYPVYDNWAFGFGLGFGSSWWDDGPYWGGSYPRYRSWGGYHRPRPPPPPHRWDGGHPRPPPHRWDGDRPRPPRPPGSHPPRGSRPPRFGPGGGGPSHGGSPGGRHSGNARPRIPRGRR